MGKTPCWENCWDFFSQVLQHGHCLLLVIGGQMRVAHSYCNIFMTHEALHRRPLHAILAYRAPGESEVHELVETVLTPEHPAPMNRYCISH